ncbi:efflux RND transporter periplasmic adaptor subunit [Parasulfitobacter algicola]|uniref:Efflux RND transporter periplasmic adaptor subunit n=1 Tax=Parasulfitobacter algicola TaxID=2614809 RepID=A0ABX2ITW2_9RHOB|nr:efflux RND transporter periplasmic adaptor subunit [Sulfitobacter algicola]NSX56357.1 efflux RND transporter periplasmic adaptor subunit [Sulfitobacter algicola]
MKLFSILTAILVSAFLYFLVFERDALMAVAANSTDDVEDETDAEENLRRVSVVALRSEVKSIDSAVLLRGRTEALRQVVVKSETSGLVMSDPLRKGSRVQAGELLCKLDPGTREAALAEANARLPEAYARQREAEARLTEAQINDRAAAKLSEGGFASQTRVASTAASVEAALAAKESAEASVQAAEAGIKGARKEIERLDIRAPFAGLLETDTAETGSLLQPGAECATIIQLDPIKLVGFAPETEVDRITVGATAGARLLSGRQVTGQVTFLSRAADPETRTFRVEVFVPNPNMDIRDGQTVEILIASDGADAHLLPGSALTLNDDGDLGVRIVNKDQRVAFSTVNFIRDTVDGVWVNGLPDAVDVIVVGHEYVTDGVPVTVTYREPEQ